MKDLDPYLLESGYKPARTIGELRRAMEGLPDEMEIVPYSHEPEHKSLAVAICDWMRHHPYPAGWSYEVITEEEKDEMEADGTNDHFEKLAQPVLKFESYEQKMVREETNEKVGRWGFQSLCLCKEEWLSDGGVPRIKEQYTKAAWNRSLLETWMKVGVRAERTATVTTVKAFRHPWRKTYTYTYQNRFCRDKVDILD